MPGGRTSFLSIFGKNSKFNDFQYVIVDVNRGSVSSGELQHVVREVQRRIENREDAGI